MGKALFITGASGYIGSHLLQKLDLSEYERVICLTRSPGTFPAHLTMNNKVQLVKGDIEDIDCYALRLTNVDTVIHIAATTGKAVQDEYFRVNSKGTEILIDQAKRNGVKNFLFISTIAVKYPDKSQYYYAQSKERGEQAVVNSGLDYLIIRPTIVIGEGAPIWKSLSSLAKGPLLPVLGNGSAVIQPVHIDDLVKSLVHIIKNDIYSNNVIELGGPELISFEEFLRKIHRIYRKEEPKLVKIPLIQIKKILALLEKRFLRILPVTAGQLSAFQHDGIVQTNQKFLLDSLKMMNVDEMIKQVIIEEKLQEENMRLDNECRILTKYLVGDSPTTYVMQKYKEAQQVTDAFKSHSSGPMDRRLMRYSIKNPFFTRVADAYSRFFAKDSLLRKKIILMMAILESSAPAYRYYDLPKDSKATRAIIRLFFAGLSFAMIFSLSILLFAPFQIMTTLSKKNGGKK
jgi:nucleoside-diphosphate-sugar epimerase